MCESDCVGFNVELDTQYVISEMKFHCVLKNGHVRKYISTVVYGKKNRSIPSRPFRRPRKLRLFSLPWVWKSGTAPSIPRPCIQRLARWSGREEPSFCTYCATSFHCLTASLSDRTCPKDHKSRKSQSRQQSLTWCSVNTPTHSCHGWLSPRCLRNPVPVLTEQPTTITVLLRKWLGLLVEWYKVAKQHSRYGSSNLFYGSSWRPRTYNVDQRTLPQKGSRGRIPDQGVRSSTAEAEIF